MYFLEILQSEAIILCGGSSWKKQTLRNRTFLLSPNGVQRLIVPVLHNGGLPIADALIRIDYSLPWIREHQGALEAAYNTSPFFDYIKTEIWKIYASQPETLFALNELLLRLLCKKLKYKGTIISAPESEYTGTKLELFDGKIFPIDSSLLSYPQVFNYKFPFVPGLSVLDEFCNKGY